MIQSLPYDENKFDKNVEFEDILTTEDDSDIGFILEVELKHSDSIKEKTN